MNEHKCEDCNHFDPVMRGNNKGLRQTDWAWCAKKSIYPVNEGPGQKFPAGVQRMTDPDKPAEPKIVKKGEVVSNCTDFMEKRQVLSKEDLLSKVKNQQQGGLLR